MSITILPVPGRLTFECREDPELLARVREAKFRASIGEGVSDQPFHLTDVIMFKRNLRPRVEVSDAAA